MTTSNTAQHFRQQHCPRSTIVATYSVGSVTVEIAVVDLQIGIIASINSAALEIAYPPPGIGAEMSGIFSEQLWITYTGGSVVQKGAGVDLQIGLP
jgi:hypothetical protein